MKWGLTVVIEKLNSSSANSLNNLLLESFDTEFRLMAFHSKNALDSWTAKLMGKSDVVHSMYAPELCLDQFC